jgi:EDD domain protein, DegV family
MNIKIVTDSASDLPKAVIDASNVEVLPLIVYLDGKEYLDNVTIEPDTIYNAMKKGSVVKTAQIPLAYFIEKFENYAQSEDYYIYLAFSSVLSGTYQSAVLAYEEVKEKYPEFEMTIIDTKCVSLGLGIIVVEAAKMAEDGATLDEILDYIQKTTSHMVHVFSVDDMEYLLRGGRVSRSQAIIGNILNIKPILHVQEGALVPFDKAKGKKKLLSKLYEYIANRGTKLDQQIVGIAHTLNEEEALEVKTHFETVYGTRKFIINQLGCAVGAHCGPGMITIFFKSEV